MAFTGKMRELMMKYGKVALGVHFSVSGASITGIYIAIKNSVDVESLLQKVGLLDKDPSVFSSGGGGAPSGDPAVALDSYDAPAPPPPPPPPVGEEKKRNRIAELAASSGGALALAILCNKALFPVRVPITIALTPPIARFLARRKFVKI